MRKNSILLYMLDPSENWKQSSGGGTCIGRGEDLVRSMEANFKAMDPDECACDDEILMNKNTDSRL